MLPGAAAPACAATAEVHDPFSGRTWAWVNPSAIPSRAPYITLSPDPLNLTLCAPGTLTITLSGPAPPGGVWVDLTSSDTTVISVQLLVMVPPNSSDVNFTVTPVGMGSTTVTASAPGFTSAAAVVYVSSCLSARWSSRNDTGSLE